MKRVMQGGVQMQAGMPMQGGMMPMQQQPMYQQQVMPMMATPQVRIEREGELAREWIGEGAKLEVLG